MHTWSTIQRMAVGTRIKALRNERGLTQEECAKQADISISYWRQIENGQRPGSLKILSAIATVLGVEVKDLMADTGAVLEDDSAAGPPAGAVEIMRVRPRSRRQVRSHAEALVARIFQRVVEDGVAVPVHVAMERLDAITEAAGLKAPLAFSTYDGGDYEGFTEYDPDEDVVRMHVRSDVWAGAVAGDGRHRFTVAHELAHGVLHQQELMDSPGRMFRDANVLPSEKAAAADIRIYETPDYQANQWASAFLMPTQAVVAYLSRCADTEQDCGPMEIADTFKVSLRAAEIRLQSLLPSMAAVADQKDEGVG